MQWLYQLFIWLYPFIARIISPVNKKARLWVNGRIGLFNAIEKALDQNKHPIIWMHCSSLGEFEQGLPVAEKLKASFPNHKILISFFSPSGYTVCKNHPIADWVFYLPMDSKSNAALFIKMVRPSIALFIKYEFWYFYLKTLHEQKIPTLLVSGIFRNDHLFFKWYGGFYRNMLGYFNHLFVQDQSAYQLLQSIGYHAHSSISGDTRFDRVLEIAQQAKTDEQLIAFCNHQRVIVAGSTWLDDDKALQYFSQSNQQVKYIIAPHSVDETRIQDCLTLYPNAVRYSNFIASTQTISAQTIVIDNMGMLSSLYQYATIAYIGGGFTNDGIHNSLEAAVYGIPLVFGPTYKKYREAIELIECNAAYSAQDASEIKYLLENLLSNSNKIKAAGKSAGDYVKSKNGASNRILNYIQENRLLIN